MNRMAAGCIGGATTQNITQTGDVLILRNVHRVLLGLLGCVVTDTFGILWPNSFGDIWQIWHTCVADRFGSPR